MILKNLDFKILHKPIKELTIYSTLIICTYKRSDGMVELIKHLVTLNDLPSELLIIDGSNDNETIEKLEFFFKENKLNLNTEIIYVVAPTGLTIQRNAGIDICRGEIIHFIDDDCFPETDYFMEIEKLFKNNIEIGGISGNVLNERTDKMSLKNKIRFWVGLYSRKHIPGMYYCNGSSVPNELKGPIYKDYEVNNLGGASMSLRKKILNSAGDFSEFFSGYAQGEDLEASLRVNRISKLIVAANAKCYHYHVPVSRPNLFKKGFMEIYNKHYIWKNNFPNKKFVCYLQFWGDVLFLLIYTFVVFIKSGFKIKFINYLRGYFKGIYFALTKNEKHKERKIKFKLIRN